MSVYKKKDKNGKEYGCYIADFTIKGNRYRITTNCKNKKQAEYIRAELINKYKDIVVNKKVSFDLIVEKFKSLSYLSLLKKPTQETFKSALTHAIPFFKEHDVFKKENVYAFLEYLETKDIGLSTIVTYKSKLSSMCNEVKKTALIDINPFANIDMSKYNVKSNEINYINPAQLQLIKDNCTNKILLLHILFAIESGLRVEEQLQLTWNRIDFKAKNMYIVDTKNKLNRTVPLTPLAIKILEKLKDNNKPFNFYNYHSLRYNWNKLKRKIGLNDITWHGFRHTFATWAVKGIHSWQTSSMKIEILQKWLGHSDIKMTMIYYHLDDSDLKKEINNQDEKINFFT